MQRINFYILIKSNLFPECQHLSHDPLLDTVFPTSGYNFFNALINAYWSMAVLIMIQILESDPLYECCEYYWFFVYSAVDDGSYYFLQEISSPARNKFFSQPWREHCIKWSPVPPVPPLKGNCPKQKDLVLRWFFCCQFFLWINT